MLERKICFLFLLMHFHLDLPFTSLWLCEMYSSVCLCMLVPSQIVLAARVQRLQKKEKKRQNRLLVLRSATASFCPQLGREEEKKKKNEQTKRNKKRGKSDKHYTKKETHRFSLILSVCVCRSSFHCNQPYRCLKLLV